MSYVFVLLMISKTTPISIFVNTFKTEAACVEQISKMEPIYHFTCLKTELREKAK